MTQRCCSRMLLCLLFFFFPITVWAGSPFAGGYFGMFVGFMADLQRDLVGFMLPHRDSFSRDELVVNDKVIRGATVASLNVGCSMENSVAVEFELQNYHQYSDLNTGPTLELFVNLLNYFMNAYYYFSPRDTWKPSYIPLSLYVGAGVGMTYINSGSVRRFDSVNVQSNSYYGAQGVGLGVKFRLGVAFDVTEGAQVNFGLQYLYSEEINVNFSGSSAHMIMNPSGIVMEMGGRIFTGWGL